MKLRVRALERRKLPDELDQLSGLARPWTWLGVLALVLAVAALGVWSFYGRIPRTVSGQGVIADPGSLAAVQSTVSGSVNEVDVSNGAVVHQGQTLARIAGSGGGLTSIVAPFTGQVVDLSMIVGQAVALGTPLYTLQRLPTPPGSAFVYLFLPSDRGAGLAPGMKVNVSVATAPSAKYGVLRGTVSQVSQTPLSTAAVKALVANPDLAAVLTQGGPPVLAEVRLTRDASNRSGFAWSTPKGPPFPLQIGSQVTAQVIQTQQRPIDVVFGTS